MQKRFDQFVYTVVCKTGAKVCIQWSGLGSKSEFSLMNQLYFS